MAAAGGRRKLVFFRVSLVTLVTCRITAAVSDRPAMKSEAHRVEEDDLEGLEDLDEEEEEGEVEVAKTGLPGR